MKSLSGLPILAAVVGMFAAAASPALACGTGKVLYEDKFETLDPSWSFPETDTTRSVGPGGLTYKWEPNNISTKLSQFGYFENYEVCADIAMQYPDKGNGFLGIAFWGVDADNYYVMDVTPVYGNFAVYRLQKGKFLKPIAWTNSAAIKTGPGVVNQLSVAVNGNKAVITINGQKVAEFKGQAPDGGSLAGIDLTTGTDDTGPSTLILSNFEVREVAQ